MIPDIKTLRIAVPLWATLLALLTLGYWLSFESTLAQIRDTQIANMTLALGQAKEVMRFRLSIPERDLHFLTSNLLVERYLKTGDQFDRRQLERFMAEFMAGRLHRFDQVRYIDNSGHEIIRVNRSDKNAVIVPGAELQSKAERYYTQHCLQLEEHDVYLSEIDLNVEYGRVEQPIKPVWRLCEAVFDGTGHRRGFVVINYLVSSLLQHLVGMSRAVEIDLAFLNPDGYWIIGPTPEKEWGFMFEDRRDQTIAVEFPEVWAQMKSTQHGAYTRHQSSGFSFMASRLSLTKDMHTMWGHYVSNTDRDSFLLAYQSDDFSAAKVNQVLQGYIPSYLALAVASMVVSLWVGFSVSRRRMILQELEKTNLELQRLSNLDALTGIANRRHLDQYLSVEVSRCSRTRQQISVILLDVDHFKAYNDSAGHTAGDRCLQQVGRLLSESTRRPSDLVARYGGEEFCIVLPDTDQAGALAIAEQIRQNLQDLGIPHPADSAGAVVTVSLGVACAVPDPGSTSEEVLHAADEALYRAKEAGRNRVST